MYPLWARDLFDKAGTQGYDYRNEIANRNLKLRRNRPKRQPFRAGSSFAMMKCWLDELLDFWLPKPVEQDMDGELVEYDWYCPLPEEIPEMFRAEPAVREADRLVRSKR